MATARTTPAKLPQATPVSSLLTYWLGYRLTQRPAKRLCAQEGRCVYFLPRGFPEPGDRDKGPSPSRATFTCAHVCMFSWQHPLWGEASTCPIPEQGAGVAHPQVNRPDSGEKNEGREGTAGQVALLGSWHPPASPLLLSLLPLASSKQESGCLGSWSRGLYRVNRLGRGRGEGCHTL